MKPTTPKLLACGSLQELADLWAASARSADYGSVAVYYPMIAKMAGPADRVVEFGTRRCESTVGFLLAGAKVTSYDFDLPDKHAALYRHIKTMTDRWTFVYGDTRTADIPPCEILFVDSLHTCDQVRVELGRASLRTSRHIMLHDTIACRDQGQNGEPGIWRAVEEFLADSQDWQITYHADHGSGLTVLTKGVVTA